MQLHVEARQQRVQRSRRQQASVTRRPGLLENSRQDGIPKSGCPFRLTAGGIKPDVAPTGGLAGSRCSTTSGPARSPVSQASACSFSSRARRTPGVPSAGEADARKPLGFPGAEIISRAQKAGRAPALSGRLPGNEHASHQTRRYGLTQIKPLTLTELANRRTASRRLPWTSRMNHGG